MRNFVSKKLYIVAMPAFEREKSPAFKGMTLSKFYTKLDERQKVIPHFLTSILGDGKLWTL